MNYCFTDNAKNGKHGNLLWFSLSEVGVKRVEDWCVPGSCLYQIH
jgi:hypothetical protein